MALLEPLKKSFVFLVKNPLFLVFMGIIALAQLLLDSISNLMIYPAYVQALNDGIFSSGIMSFFSFMLGAYPLELVIFLAVGLVSGTTGIYAVFVASKSVKQGNYTIDIAFSTLKDAGKALLVMVFLGGVFVLMFFGVLALEFLTGIMNLLGLIGLIVFLLVLLGLGLLFMNFQQVMIIEEINLKEALKKTFNFTSKRLVEMFILGVAISGVSFVIFAVYNWIIGAVFSQIFSFNFINPGIIDMAVYGLPLIIAMALGSGFTSITLALHYLENK